MSLKFHEMTIDAYLSALGSTSPAPGGGAAAGLIGAQACALGEMVSRFIFLDLMDEDAKNFRELMALLQSPRDPADTKKKEKLEAAFKKSAEAPYRMADTMSELLPAFTQLLLHCNKNVITDAVIAAEEAVSCIRAARLNVEINAKYVKDEFYAREMKDSYLTWENAISAIDAVLTYQVKL